jgi:hypothetical protein
VNVASDLLSRASAPAQRQRGCASRYPAGLPDVMSATLSARLDVVGEAQAQADRALIVAHGDDVVLALEGIRQALRQARHHPDRLRPRRSKVRKVESLMVAHEVGAVVKIDEVAGHGLRLGELLCPQESV